MEHKLIRKVKGSPPGAHKAQARGRDAFFESYRMTVAASIIPEYDFHQA